MVPHRHVYGGQEVLRGVLHPEAHWNGFRKKISGDDRMCSNSETIGAHYCMQARLGAELERASPDSDPPTLKAQFTYCRSFHPTDLS